MNSGERVNCSIVDIMFDLRNTFDGSVRKFFFIKISNIHIPITAIIMLNREYKTKKLEIKVKRYM